MFSCNLRLAGANRQANDKHEPDDAGTRPDWKVDGRYGFGAPWWPGLVLHLPPKNTAQSRSRQKKDPGECPRVLRAEIRVIRPVEPDPRNPRLVYVTTSALKDQLRPTRKTRGGTMLLGCVPPAVLEVVAGVGLDRVDVNRLNPSSISFTR